MRTSRSRRCVLRDIPDTCIDATSIGASMVCRSAKRGLGAAAPSGAGESGWFGGRKPPLPSRGVVSPQDVPPASKRKERISRKNKKDAPPRKNPRIARPLTTSVAKSTNQQSPPPYNSERRGASLRLLARILLGSGQLNDSFSSPAVYHTAPARGKRGGYRKYKYAVSAPLRLSK